MSLVINFPIYNAKAGFEHKSTGDVNNHHTTLFSIKVENTSS